MLKGKISIEIEDNIPIPQRKKYPLKDMQIGQSFFIPTNKPTNSQSTICILAKRLKIKLTTRSIYNDKEQLIGLRVWRVK